MRKHCSRLSSGAGRVSGERRAPSTAVLVAACALAAAGCSRATTRPEPPPAASARAASAAAENAGAANAATEPRPFAASDSLPPSEVMTPAELAAIPDPVPQSSAPVPPVAVGTSSAAGTTAGSTSAPSPESPPPPLETDGADAGTTEAETWRVQIFASPDLAQADRVAKEASAKLGVEYSIEFESGLYKVRLGSFGSEAAAQALRESAVGAGYPGAFRTRSNVATAAPPK
jgi:hypothetical protein